MAEARSLLLDIGLALPGEMPACHLAAWGRLCAEVVARGCRCQLAAYLSRLGSLSWLLMTRDAARHLILQSLVIISQTPYLRGVHRDRCKMALKPVSIRRLTRLRTVGFLALLLLAGTVGVLVWTTQSRVSPTAAPSPSPASPAVASLAGSPEPAPGVGGEVVPAERRLTPRVGHALIRYFEPQSAQPPHGSFVEKSVDSTKLYWFRLRECETERKCPYWPWWRRSDVNVIVVPDDFVVGIMEPDNTCHGLLRINPDSDYSLACRGPRVRVVSAPSAWKGGGPLPRTEWLAPAWNPLNNDSRR